MVQGRRVKPLILLLMHHHGILCTGYTDGMVSSFFIHFSSYLVPPPPFPPLSPWN